MISYEGFLIWLKEIDIIAKLHDYPGESYTDATGHVYWVNKYNAGLSSIDAFEEDRVNTEFS